MLRKEIVMQPGYGVFIESINGKYNITTAKGLAKEVFRTEREEKKGQNQQITSSQIINPTTHFES